MLRPVALSALLLTALVAGCADTPSGDNALVAEPEAFNEVEVTDTTGAIRGIVVSEAIVPIADVLVQLVDGRNQTTDAEGAFVFNGLEPGDYFLSASKPGYFTQQASTTVVAGEKEPAITKILLLADALAQPYAQTLQWDGYLSCGVMWSSGTLADAPYPLYIGSYAGANACGVEAIPLVGDGRFIGQFEFASGRIPDFVQAEGVWEGTQPLSNDLTMGFWRGGSNDWKFVYGTSPLVLTTNSTEIIDTFDENKTDLPMRMFPGQSDDPASLVVTTNQAFTVFQTQFYGFLPREGWLFIDSGACITPDDCGADP